MTKAETILAVEKVTKTFGKGASLTKAVDNLSFKVKSNIKITEIKNIT